MSTYQIYIPSAEKYRTFLERLETKGTNELNGLRKEVEFFKDFSDNFRTADKEKLKELMKKLNHLYKTRISLDVLDEMASFILQIDLNKELESDGYDLVDGLRYAHSKVKKDGFYDYLSFASKFSHHCNPDKYPIYDSVNVSVFKMFLGYKDKRNYREYVECFKAFCSAIEIDKFENNIGFYIDKYIQAIGKHEESLLFR